MRNTNENTNSEEMFDPINDYLFLAEFTDNLAGNEGFMIGTFPNIRSMMKYANENGLFDLDTEAGKPHLLNLLKGCSSYKITNNDPVSQVIYEVPGSLVTFRVVQLKPDYTAGEFIRQRSKK